MQRIEDLRSPTAVRFETCRNDCSTGLGTLWGTLLGGGGDAEEVSLRSTPRFPAPPLTGRGCGRLQAP